MGNDNKYKEILWIVSALLLILLVVFNLHSGLTLKKIGIPGLFVLEFGEIQNGEGGSAIMHEGVPPEITVIIEELQQHLANNENEKEKARHEMERLRTMLETNPDARRAIEEQEQLLERLTMESEHMGDELRRLHEQQ